LKELKDKMQRDEERDKRTYALIFLGVQSLAKDSLFIPSKAFVSSAISGIGSGLGKIFLKLSGKKMITIHYRV
jgi:hypothetical protein